MALNSWHKGVPWAFLLLLLCQALMAGGVPLYRIHCGGGAFVGHPLPDSTKVKSEPIPTLEWQADAYFTGGAVVSLESDTVMGPKTLPFFRTERYSPANAPMTYSFPVPAGQYQVILYFAEIFSGAQKVGGRIFNVLVNGTVTIPNLDIFALVGGYKGMADTLMVNASQGTITLTFENIANAAKLSGIEIARLPVVKATQPPYRINCGASDDYIDPDGKIWEADSHYLNGKARGYQTFFTSDYDLFKTDRTNDTVGMEPLAYEFPAMVGNYKVSLYFAEGWDSAKKSGDRIFNVIVSGDTVLKKLDLVSQYGFATAVVLDFNVFANGHIPIRISFENGVGMAKINAIEILPLVTTVQPFSYRQRATHQRIFRLPDLLGRNPISRIPH